jgi:hypothetical protein
LFTFDITSETLSDLFVKSVIKLEPVKVSADDVLIELKTFQRYLKAISHKTKTADEVMHDLDHQTGV